METKLTMKKDEHFKVRRRVAVLALGTAAVIGALSPQIVQGVRNDIANYGGHGFTDEELAALPQRPEAVPSTGIDTIIFKTDPRLIDDANGLLAVESYVNAQNGGNGMVEIPVIPAAQNHNTHKGNASVR